MSIRFAVEVGKDTEALALESEIKGVPGDVGTLIREGVQAVIEPLQEKGLALCELMHFGLNLLHPDEATRQKGIDELIAVIPLARKASCPYIVTTAGNYNPNLFALGSPDNLSDEALSIAAKGLSEPLKMAESEGVYLCIKPFIKTAVFSAERFLRLKEMTGSEHLKVSLDVSGMYEVTDIWNPRPKVLENCRLLKDHIGLLHLKEVDMVPGYYVQIELAPHDKGPTPWDLILKECSDSVPEDSWVIIEHIANLDDGRRAVALMKKTAQSLGIEYS